MKPGTRRIFHRSFFAVAALATLIVLFYAEEDWRGARAWAAAKRDLQAKGESLELRDFIPPPVPDDQNLAMAPLFVRMFSYQIDPKTRQLTFYPPQAWSNNDTFKALSEMPWGRERTGLPIPVGNGDTWMTGHAMDLPRWQAYYRQRKDFPQPAQPQAPADDALLALTRFKPLLDELAQAASERPETRFPYNWTQQPPWSISLPAYNALQILTATLRLRAVAELRAGQTTLARQDIVLMLRLRRSTERDPTLIASLVDTTCLGILMQSIWEGLADRRWSAEDLDALRDGLRPINALRQYQQAIRGERAFFIVHSPEQLQNRDHARELAETVPPMTSGDQQASSFSLRYWLWKALPYWPRGWYVQNAVVASRYLQEYGVDMVDAVGHQVSLAKLREIDPALQKIPMMPGTLLAHVTLPFYSSFVYKFAQTQTTIDQALTACALEKYFLNHHAYPAALTALVPDYLERVPNDVIDGAPMRYRLTMDGRYQLWSIGRDGRDDGGAIVWPPDRTWRRTNNGSPTEQAQKFPSPVRDQGDWVWQYAPAEPPDPPANRSRLESLPPG